MHCEALRGVGLQTEIRKLIRQIQSEIGKSIVNENARIILAREVAPNLFLRSNYLNYVGYRSELHQNHVTNLRGWDHGDDGHLPSR